MTGSSRHALLQQHLEGRLNIEALLKDEDLYSIGVTLTADSDDAVAQMSRGTLAELIGIALVHFAEILFPVRSSNLSG